MNLLLITVFILIAILLLLYFQKKCKAAETTSLTTQTTTAPPPSTVNDIFNFIDTIEKYTLTDIITLSDIARKAEDLDDSLPSGDPKIGTGRCSTALASLCFATIEQIGLILRTDLTIQNTVDAITSGNRDNLMSFFDFYSRNGLQTIPPGELNAIYNLFRNKITHNLFPNYRLGVNQNKANSHTDIVNNINGTNGLNINFISNYIMQAIPIFKSLINDPQQYTLKATLNANINLIKTAEETKIRNQYRSTPSIQPYYSRWLPGFQF